MQVIIGAALASLVAMLAVITDIEVISQLPVAYRHPFGLILLIFSVVLCLGLIVMGAEAASTGRKAFRIPKFEFLKKR